MPKTIKIFIASSSELKADRDDFARLIGIENKRRLKQDVALELVQWEDFPDAMSDTRLQSEYNKAICECDIALFLFFTKVGKYTEEEFNTAYKVFKTTGKPKVYTYLKDAPINTGSITKEINTLLSFKEKIADLGHFPTRYTNIADLSLHFKYQLDEMFPHLPDLNDPQPTTDIQQGNTFNEALTIRLIEAIQEFSPAAKKFLDTARRKAADWQTKSDLSNRAKAIIASGFVGILGIQLCKLMAIGK